MFAESFEQRTENPRVGKSVIAPVNMHPEGSDLIEAFFMAEGFVWKGLFLSDMLILVMCKKQLRTLRNCQLYACVCCEDFYFGIEKVIFRAFTTSDLIAHILNKTVLTVPNSVRSGQVEIGCQYFSMNSKSYANL